jgi:hypothetical protein
MVTIILDGGTRQRARVHIINQLLGVKERLQYIDTPTATTLHADATAREPDANLAPLTF